MTPEKFDLEKFNGPPCRRCGHLKIMHMPECRAAVDKEWGDQKLPIGACECRRFLK